MRCFCKRDFSLRGDVLFFSFKFLFSATLRLVAYSLFYLIYSHQAYLTSWIIVMVSKLLRWNYWLIRTTLNFCLFVSRSWRLSNLNVENHVHHEFIVYIRMQICFYHIGFTNDSYFVIPTLDGKKFGGVGKLIQRVTNLCFTKLLD